MPDLLRTAGRLVGAPLGALARRSGGKPMHPRGTVFDAVLHRHDGPAWGVPWLSATATDDVVARISRGAGLPAPLPDVLGLAIRLPGGTGRSAGPDRQVGSPTASNPASSASHGSSAAPAARSLRSSSSPSVA